MIIETHKLDQNIEIYSDTSSPDGYGGVIPNNEVYWTTFAETKALRSSRNLEANQSELKQVFSFVIRYRTDKYIKNNMLLKWRNNWFSIKGYIPSVVDRIWVKFDAELLNDTTLVEGTPETT